VKCYCKMTLEELRHEYGQINRAEATLASGLKALKIMAPSTEGKKVVFAYGVLQIIERRIKSILKEKEDEENPNNDDIVGAPV